MQYFLAALPILIVLLLMVGLHWGGQRAGPLAWLVGVVIGLLSFGLSGQVFWVSQLKGLFLSAFVLAILWPALLLYRIVDQIGGIHAIVSGLEHTLADRGLLLILLAWAFSGLLEGLAGFGLPIAIVAPMLVALGVSPVPAVAAVAIGHAWSVTFGDMSVVFQTLAAIVHMDMAALAPMSALLLGLACILCGLGAAMVLGQARRWPAVVVLGALMAAVQYALVLTPLLPLAVLCAGMVGLLGGIAWGKLSAIRRNKHVQTPPEVEAPQPALKPKILAASMSSYALLALFLGIISLSPTLRSSLNRLTLQMQFPAVTTTTGFSTPEALGQALRPLTHPGTLILLVALLSYLVYRLLAYNQRGSWKPALAATWRSGAPVSVGVISMVGLSTLMEHTGMTPLLALGLSRALGAVFPLVSPLVGVLGAFATGSNNNSNVLFGPLQASVSSLLGIDPRILLAAQTTGGALGSMIAPAKIIVGCSTVGLKGRDGEVLRRTLLYNLGICLLLGLVALLFTL